MRQKVKDVSEERASKVGCNHYWVIESANGPVSKGVCKYCGDKREFSNVLPQFPVITRHTRRVFDLPELDGVEFDKDSSS